ncbi:MAG: hypothetical protein ACLPX5_15185 [Dissulfurispiraceae bacterium]
MPLYDSGSEQRLIDKLDYEIWVLDILGSTQDLYFGGIDISTIQLTNRQEPASISVGVQEHLGATYAQGVIDAITPLTFTASFKILDMLHEWILEENVSSGVITEVPWRFSEKVKLIKATSLSYPPLFVSNTYIKDYTLALFTNLLPYRDEIVHRHNFSVNQNKLSLIDSKTANNLTLDRMQMGYLVRLVVSLARCLGGKLGFDTYLDRLIKYYFDRFTMIHQLVSFNQKLPIVVNVELIVPKEADSFPADLKFVRHRVAQIHPGQDVFFNLTIILKDEENVMAKWLFPVKCVPAADVLDLTLDSYVDFRLN